MAYQEINDVKMGKNAQAFNFVNLYGCEIGENTKIASLVEIQKGVKIGKNCKILTFAFIPTGVTIEDNVFVGPHVSFTNDKWPRAANKDGGIKGEDDWELSETLVKKGASIGANSTIICGITIGENAMVAAGSVVTKNVPANTLVAGCPARTVKTIGE